MKRATTVAKQLCSTVLLTLHSPGCNYSQWIKNIDGHHYFTLCCAKKHAFQSQTSAALTAIPYKWNCSRWLFFILVKAQIWFPPVPKQMDIESDLFLAETKWNCFRQSTNHAVGGELRERLAVWPAPPSCALLTVQMRCGWQSMGLGFNVIIADERWGRFSALVTAAGVRVDLAAGGLKGVISEEHEVPLRWAICFIKRPFSQSIQLSSGEPSAVLPALYRLSYWADATCGTG